MNAEENLSYALSSDTESLPEYSRRNLLEERLEKAIRPQVSLPPRVEMHSDTEKYEPQQRLLPLTERTRRRLSSTLKDHPDEYGRRTPRFRTTRPASVQYNQQRYEPDYGPIQNLRRPRGYLEELDSDDWFLPQNPIKSQPRNFTNTLVMDINNPTLQAGREDDDRWTTGSSTGTTTPPVYLLDKSHSNRRYSDMRPFEDYREPLRVDVGASAIPSMTSSLVYGDTGSLQSLTGYVSPTRLGAHSSSADMLTSPPRKTKKIKSVRWAGGLDKDEEIARDMPIESAEQLSPRRFSGKGELPLESTWRNIPRIFLTTPSPKFGNREETIDQWSTYTGRPSESLKVDRLVPDSTQDRVNRSWDHSDNRLSQRPDESFLEDEVQSGAVQSPQKLMNLTRPIGDREPPSLRRKHRLTPQDKGTDLKARRSAEEEFMTTRETESLIRAIEALHNSLEESNKRLEVGFTTAEPLPVVLRQKHPRSASQLEDITQRYSSSPNRRASRARGGRHEISRRSGGHRRTEEASQNRDEKVAVEVRVVFLKIGEIDTLKEFYYADAFLQAKWREPKLDGRTTEELGITELEQFWNPLLYIDNILSETKDTQWLQAQKNEAGEVYLVERRRIKGLFMETLELNDFPLDVQDLTITVTTERPDNEVDIIPDQNEMSAINKQTFVDQQEWKLHEHVEITKRIMKQEFCSSLKSHSCLSVTCRAARRPGYFYWNVFLIMFMITGLAFATFAVSPDKAELRLRLSFTLILTSVTFKYVITQSLPKISYLTYMDKYVLMSLGILCIISIWHAVVTLIDPDAQLTLTNSTKSGDSMSNWTGFKKPTILFPPSANETSSANQTNGSSRSERQRNRANLRSSEFVRGLTNTEREYSGCSRTNRMACPEWQLVRQIEQHVFTSFVIIYVIAHLVFVFWLYFDASKRRREMLQKDKEYRKRKRKAMSKEARAE
ncbi:unnamed protein product [Calicophoron daubneyi]|uniref:Neurotransmitter-gated ion-channel ligand-binding domain-containing protein n=1 Tax=Calicophoron daubneyi TaxID=300641 RepID=A0AAV2TNN4_CALDB